LTGQLYEVDIPESDVLLDEDKEIREQSKQVQKALTELWEKEFSEKQLLNMTAIPVDVIYNGKESYIKASYHVENTTSLESLTAGILPDLEYDGFMGNWTQTYIWEERFSCCEDRTSQQIEMENLMMNRTNSFPYNLHGNENFPLP